MERDILLRWHCILEVTDIRWKSRRITKWGRHQPFRLSFLDELPNRPQEKKSERGQKKKVENFYMETGTDIKIIQKETFRCRESNPELHGPIS